MVDGDVHGASPKNESTHAEAKEDAETRAARRELKQSSISDPPAPSVDAVASSTESKPTRPDTPVDNAIESQENDSMKTQISSPKKKRAHDQLDGGKDADENDALSITSTDSTKDRASRLEPEKKRARDEDSKGHVSNTSAEQTTENEKSPTPKSSDTSNITFAASGFSKLATGSSPFMVFGSSQPSVFASVGNSLQSPFGAGTTATTPKPMAALTTPKLSFGSAKNASPFAGLSTANGFGSRISSSSFGSAFSGAKGTQTFGLPAGNPIQSRKPAKPFGAPDSDGDDDADDEDGEEPDLPEAERAFSPDKDSEEKRKMKLQKVEVDDGETGEATIVSVRAKMFHHHKEAGWKERGAGMLKINAPITCVEFDDAGLPISGSFDASGLDVKNMKDTTVERKVVRLIMRQDQTHRVILNTVLLPAMKFQEKASLKSVGILFTAFEGEEAKPVSITMKMSAANAKLFLNEIGIIQKELQTN